MAIYLVNQGDNYKVEHEGGYLWAPTLMTNGKPHKGHTNLSKVRQGDIIIHNKKGIVVDISVATNDYYMSDRPSETRRFEYTDEGYMVNVESIGDITPVKLNILWAEMDRRNKEHSVSECAFTIKGAKQFYLSILSDDEIQLLISEIIKNQSDEKMKKKIIKLFDDDYINPKFSAAVEILDDYSLQEQEIINFSDSVQPSIPDRPQKQAYYTVNNSDTKKPKRNTDYARYALNKANYKCEYDPSDLTFERPNGTQYTEPHHLIPICYCDEFEFSLDDPANIVSLCSHHHNQIHYGKDDDKIRLLEKLWNDRKEQLKKRNIYVEFEKLLDYYKIKK